MTRGETRHQTRHLWSGFWATSLGTLASRVLGLVRDMATAALLGLGEGGVMDAFVIAFRLPNLTRRVFGEGALAASFLPVFTAEYQRDTRRAWQLVSVLFTWLAIVLAALVLAGETLCALFYFFGPEVDARTSQLVGLTAAMLPYMIFICLAAQASATLQSLLHFRWPAISPAMLNIGWLAAVWIVAPRFADDKLAQAHVIAAAIVISGVLQFAVQLPALRALGFRFDYDWPASRDAFGRVCRAMLPIAFGMAVTQINTLLDSLIAWALSAEAGASQTIGWLGDAVRYPMETGAAAAVYYGERFYQFPVGILGVAIATVIYPLVSRHAARGDTGRIGADLTIGLRLVGFTALPAGIGIMLLAEPLARVLFERGEFTAADASRAAGMIAAYASGVWAYCAIPVLVRGFYAVGQAQTPARIGLVAVGINLVLNLSLVWPLAERGLAFATAIAAAVQVILLAIWFSRDGSLLAWRELGSTIVKSAIAATAMSFAVIAIGWMFPAIEDASRARQAMQLGLSVLTGISVYLVAAWLLGMCELDVLLGRPAEKSD